MTQKELLYMEDAVMHESNLIDIAQFTIDTLEDEDLVKFMKKQLKKHEDLKSKLINVLEESSNE